MGVNKNFVVKNGLEVDTNLILADADINGVGIGTSNIYYKLHVNGGIGATDLYVSGIATFPYVNLSGTVAAGSSLGIEGQYLVRSGAGVTWTSFPSYRSSTTFTATASQTVFAFDYTVGLLDVYINGVRLTESEYVAVDGIQVVLNQPCFGGESVDLITYNGSAPGYAFTGIYGISVSEEGSYVGTPGEVVSINFVGSAVTAVGSGAGVTVYITDTGGGESYWESSTAGINTISNVGIATTNPRFALEVGPVGYADTALWVNGNARVTGILTVGTASIVLDGSNNIINVGSGITISGDTGRIDATEFYASGLQVGVITATTIVYEGGVTLTQDWLKTAAGIHTLSRVGIGTTNPTSALTVNGGTSLETLNVSGVSTFTGNVSFGSSALFGNNKIIFGSGESLEIGHSGSGAQIYNYGTGKLAIQSPDEIEFRTPTGFYARFTENFGTLLYDNQNQIRLQTISNNTVGLNAGVGVTITGTTYTNDLSVSGVSTISGDGTNAYLRYGSTNAYTNFVTTYNVSQVGGVPLISANANGAALSEDTTLNAAYWRIRTLPTGAEVNGTLQSQQLSVSGVSTLSSNVSVGGTISIDGGVTLATNNATIVGTAGSAGEIKQIAGAPFYYDGSAWREFVLSSGTPVSVPADTEWDNVVFRATFDDDFTDAKFGATPVFVSDGSSIVGAAVTIGTGAYRNLGGIGGVAGAGVSYAYRSEYDFTGSWTIEFWINHDTNPLTGYYTSVISQISSTDTSGNWTFGYASNGVTISYIWANENGTDTTIFQADNTFFSNNYRDKWVHYALVREGDNGSIHFYVNGVESSLTVNDAFIDNDILHINGAGLVFGAGFGQNIPSINLNTWNPYSLDAIFDDVRISCGVGTAGQRYTSINDAVNPTFTPPTTALPTTGTLSSYVQPPGDKYGEITLGGSPSWRGTSGVTVTQQSSGNYRVSFASTYTNANDYYVLSQGMDQGFASYVGIARSTTHVDLAINKQSDDTAVDTGALAVQIKNHI